MRQTEIIMGMPITVEIIDYGAAKHFPVIFDYFRKVDARYSTYKPESEISRINAGLPKNQWSQEMKTVLELCEQTRQQTQGYFNIEHNGIRDPSGLVKGWAIQNVAAMLKKRGIQNFYIEAGGDIQAEGSTADGQPWSIGIRNPFNASEIIKVISVSGEGVATSGTYIRGQHIYDPLHPKALRDDIQSLTVTGPNIYDADRFATAAFAMGEKGISFIEALPGFEGYLVTKDKLATYTTGFERYVRP